MKKLICLFLLLAMMVTLVACKNKEPEVFTPNTEAEIAAAYIYGGQANIATRSLVEKDLTKITLACVYYDITGKQIENRQLIECNITEKKNVLLWQVSCPEMAVYMDCIVFSTQDADGNISSAQNVDIWEETVVSAFQIETYQSTLIDSTTEAANTASTNPYATLSNIVWNDSEITVDLETTAESEVKSVYLFALWFDGDGAPIETGSCSYCKNGELMVAHIQSLGLHSYVFTAPEKAHSAKLLVQAVDFTDGTQWTNPYCYEWIVHNRLQAN